MSSCMRVIILLTISGTLLGSSGCHSAFMQASVINRSGKPIHLFEVDYPTASFGSGELAAGAEFKYRFKVLGDGPVQVTWTDAAEHEHKAVGPTLHEKQEGGLQILLGSETAEWISTMPQPH